MSTGKMKESRLHAQVCNKVRDWMATHEQLAAPAKGEKQ
jgi:hypothetical protein